jgi:glutaryl-CoA dehydrogenase
MTEFWQDPLSLNQAAHRRRTPDFGYRAWPLRVIVLLPGVIEANRHEKFDRFDHCAIWGRWGMLGPTIQGHGCSGVSHVAYGLIAAQSNGSR